MIVLTTLLLSVGFLVFDLLTPLSSAEWGLYLAPLLMSFRARQKHYPFILSGVCTVFLVLGFVYTPPGGVDRFTALLSRVVGVFGLWLTAALLVQRKQAEKALADNERRFRAILDNSPLSIFVKDLSGRYEEFSRECEIVAKKSRANVLGKTDYEVFPKELADDFVAADKAILQSGRAAQEEMKFPTDDGVLTHLITKFPLFDPQGKCNAICGVAADVTSLKRVEQALRENQERLDLAQTAAGIGTFDWIMATQEVTWSTPLERLYGLAAGSFGGNYQSWLEMVHPEDRERANANAVRAFEGRSEFEDEFRIVRADGPIRWVRSTAKVLCDESGRALRMVGINIDITEQRKIQDAITFSNQRLGLIAQVTAAVVGAVPLKEEGCKLAEQVMTAFGVDACIIRTLEGSDLVFLASAGVTEENIPPTLPGSWDLFREMMSNRRPGFIPDIREYLKTGIKSERGFRGQGFVSYAGAPLLVHDQIIGILGIYSRAEQRVFSATDLEHLQIVANHIAVAIANDRLFREVRSQKDQLGEQIAERKRAEEALRRSEGIFRAISEQSMMGIYILQDGRFAYVNPKYAEIFGYTQDEMLALDSIYETIADEDLKMATENVRRRMEGQARGIHYRMRGKRKEGTIITVEIHGMRSELNGKTAIIGTLQDITEREKDESALRQTKEQLQSLSRRLLEMQEAERRHIARELHDEIGQALTALKINLQALQRMPDSNTYVPRLLDSINIVDRTLRQVRTLSLDLRPSMLDDLGLCAALRWYADQQAQRAGLRIQFVATLMEERLEPTLETACFRVAQEALTNIVRHAKANSVTLELGQAGGELHLVVRDDGIGFDMAVRKELARGVSMGMVGMAERASLMGGRIELKSAPGQGTEVHAWFPVAQFTPEPERANELAVK